MKTLTIILLFLTSIISTAQEPTFSPNYMVGNWKESHTEIIDQQRVTFYVRSNYHENANMFRFSKAGIATFIPYNKPSRFKKPRNWCGNDLNRGHRSSITYNKYDSKLNQLIYRSSNDNQIVRYQLKRIEKDTFIMYVINDHKEI